MDDSGALVDLNMGEPFHSLHIAWFAFYQPGRQHDAAEYAGWLREQYLSAATSNRDGKADCYMVQWVRAPCMHPYCFDALTKKPAIFKS